jgi:hypothetical protein
MMKLYLEIALGAVLAAVLVFGYVHFLDLLGPQERVYNCSIAEISPDFPPQVREECRKLRMDKIK